MQQTKNKSHGKNRNSWKSSGASVSGHYNTPPLQEDLVPRSRMAPEGNRRGREEVKLSCFFDKRVKPKNLEKVEQIDRKKATEMNEIANNPLEKRNKEHYGNLEIARLRMTSAKDKKEIGTTLVEK